MQVSKGIFAIDDATVVGILAILVDELGGEGSTAEDHGHGDALFVEAGQVVFHEGGGFHQQAAHGNTVGVVLAVGGDDVLHRLLDA